MIGGAGGVAGDFFRSDIDLVDCARVAMLARVGRKARVAKVAVCVASSRTIFSPLLLPPFRSPRWRRGGCKEVG